MMNRAAAAPAVTRHPRPPRPGPSAASARAAPAPHGGRRTGSTMCPTSASMPQSARRRVRDGALRQVAPDPPVAQLLGRLLLDRRPPVARGEPPFRLVTTGGYPASPGPCRSWHHAAHGFAPLPRGAAGRPAACPRRRARHPARGAGRRPLRPPVVCPTPRRGAGPDRRRAPGLLPGRRTGGHDGLVPGHLRGLRRPRAGPRRRRGPAPALRGAGRPGAREGARRGGPGTAVRGRVHRAVRRHARRRIGVPRWVRADRGRAGRLPPGALAGPRGDGQDVLAVETIPEIEEARAVAMLLGELPGTAAWISFSCADGGPPARRRRSRRRSSRSATPLVSWRPASTAPPRSTSTSSSSASGPSRRFAHRGLPQQRRRLGRPRRAALDGGRGRARGRRGGRPLAICRCASSSAAAAA